MTYRRMEDAMTTHTYMEPFAIALDLASGRLDPSTSSVRRHLSDMRGMYADAEAESAMLASGDPPLYEVLQYDVPNEAGQLIVCTTVLYPGRVGDEYFMTKGHFHAERSTGEVYLGLGGEGMLLMQVEDRFSCLRMERGTVAYVPPYWAHRSVNVGDEPLIFFAVYPGNAGHDYGTIERAGFAQRVVERNGKPVLVPSAS